MAMTNLNIRIDEDLKKSTEAVLAEMGLNMTSAFNVFARTVVREKRIPFDIDLNVPNAETIAAMKEAEIISRNPRTKRYSSFGELVSEVNNEV